MNNLVFIFVLVAVAFSVPVDDSQANDVPDAIIPEPRPTILGLVLSQPDQFGILAKAVAAVPDLPMTLDDPSARLTVLAPTDDAFTALTRLLVGDPELNSDDKDDVFEKLGTAIAPLAELEEAKFSTVASILAYHVVGKSRSFQKLEKKGTAKTLQGDTLEFTNGTVIDNDASRDNAVADPRNIFVQNGWVHVIDSVLLPFNLDTILQGPDETPAMTPVASEVANEAIDIAEADNVPDAVIPDPRPSILGLVQSQPDQFGILARAAASVEGLPVILDDPKSRLTIFAPTDAAFTALTKTLVPDIDLDEDNKDTVFEALTSALEPLAEVPEAKFSTIASILSYHAVGDAFSFQDLEKRGSVETLQGDNVTFSDGRVVDKDNSRDDAIARPRNVFLQNGWVHVIDSVLLPFNLRRVLQASSMKPNDSATSQDDPEAIDPSEAEGIPDAIFLTPRSSILGYLESKPDQFGILRLAADTIEDLPTTLNASDARLTLFAPTDEAFTELARKLSPNAELSHRDKGGVLETLATAIAPLMDLPSADSATLQSILAYHLLLAPFPYQELEKKERVETAQGNLLTFMDGKVIDLDDSRDDPTPLPRNVFATNGWVHVLDRVLLPFNLETVLKEVDALPVPISSPAPMVTEEPMILPTVSPDLVSEPALAVPEDESFEPENDGPACFPGSAMVRLSNGSSLTMSALKAGDEIHVGNLQTSRVFAFTHKKESHENWFYSLETASGHQVTLTGGHYIYVNGALVTAEDVQIGEMLRTEVGNSPVVAVRRVRGKGLFAPHTIHGDIEVDGILVSGYSRALHPTIAHCLLAPVRALAKYADVVEPLGTLFYNGADALVPFLPKGWRRQRERTV